MFLFEKINKNVLFNSWEFLKFLLRLRKAVKSENIKFYMRITCKTLVYLLNK